jgi:transcriptional regulator with XRE-family HTH domain
MFITNEEELQRWRRAVRLIVWVTRLDADLSQEELANRLHVSRNAVANWESGRRAIQVGELPLIAQALQCSPETLFRRILAWTAEDC